MTARPDAGDRGSVAVETAILLPAFLILIVLAIVVGRTTIAQNAVDLAAHDAARAASISRTADVARSAALAAAGGTLTRQGIGCGPLTVAVDTAGFSRPVGEPAAVTVTVTCVVSLADVAPPGAPASRTLSASFTSPLDRYRGRQ